MVETPMHEVRRQIEVWYGDNAGGCPLSWSDERVAQQAAKDNPHLPAEEVKKIVFQLIDEHAGEPKWDED